MEKIKLEKILERVSEVIGSKVKSKIAMALHSTPQAMGHWKERKTIPWEGLAQLSLERNIPLKWLVYGDGPMHNQAMPAPLTIQLTDKFRTMHKDFAYDNYIPVPLLHDRAAAGLPANINENDIDGYCLIYADKDWIRGNADNYTCVRIEGRSMSPVLEPGDIVAIDHNQRDPRKLDGQMVAFRKNGGVTVKWLKIVDREIVGVPQNVSEKLDTVIKLTPAESENGIIGRIAWWWAKR